mgnify:CR=1 FL=1
MSDLPEANLTCFLPRSGQKMVTGLINHERYCGYAGILKRATARSSYEVLDDPYVTINTVLA